MTMVTLKGNPRTTFRAMQFTGDNFDEINHFGGVSSWWGECYENGELYALGKSYSTAVKLTPGMWVVEVPYTDEDEERMIGLPYSEELFNELWAVCPEEEATEPEFA